MADPETQKIAVVDDDRAVCDSLQFLLEVMGYVVEKFASAAAFLSANLQEIGWLILDHHMPHMTGLQLAERLRSDGVTLPIPPRHWLAIAGHRGAGCATWHSGA